MLYAEFCRRAGLTLPPAWEPVYREAQRSGELTRPPRTEQLELFYTAYLDQVRQAAAQITADPVALRYYNLLRVRYFISTNGLFLPPQPGNVMRNFAPTLALIANWEQTQRELNRRGIDGGTAARIRKKPESYLQHHEEHLGYPATSETLFVWAVHYLRPDLYPIGSLEFEVTTMAGNETVFRHRQTGEAVWLQEPTETDTAYSGTVYGRGGQEGSPVTLSKSEYALWVAPGEDILSVHIPQGADISEVTCTQSYRAAKTFFAQHYPEKHFKAFYCRSWLMDPDLAVILQPGSRIASFQSFYRRYPYKSDGNEVFVFVHPAPVTDYTELPERTSLERALKQRYLSKDPIYRYAGLHDLEGV